MSLKAVGAAPNAAFKMAPISRYRTCSPAVRTASLPALCEPDSAAPAPPGQLRSPQTGECAEHSSDRAPRPAIHSGTPAPSKPDRVSEHGARQLQSVLGVHSLNLGSNLRNLSVPKFERISEACVIASFREP